MEDHRPPHATLARIIPFGSFLLLWLVLFWVYQPARYYFFNDEWDMLYGLLLSPRNILTPHNEYFLPLFKAIFFAEYKGFGAAHIFYMLVALAMHAANAALVYWVGRSSALRRWAALSAAALFAFSAVPWEITAGSFGQCVTLPTSCTLLAVLVMRTRPMTGGTAAAIAALSLAAFWVGGPPPVWLPLVLSLAFLQARTSEAPPGGGRTTVAPALAFAAIWAPLAVYAASVRAVMTFDAVLASHQTRISWASIPDMIQYTWVGAIFGLISPSLTGRQGYSTTTNLVNAALVALFLAYAYWRLPRKAARREFWFLTAFILLPYPFISLGRMQLGLSLASSSRYQYVPLAGFVILILFGWQAAQESFRRRAAQRGFAALGLVLLAYNIAVHAGVLREGTPAAAWGLSAQAFMQQVKAAGDSGRIVDPESPVPEYVHTSGTFPLWKVQQVLAGTISRN